MLKSILSSFARSYGRRMGSTAARQTGFLALPILVVVAIICMIELLGGRSPADLLNFVTTLFTHRGW
jgi:hypothetical protein